MKLVAGATVSEHLTGAGESPSMVVTRLRQVASVPHSVGVSTGPLDMAGGFP